MRHAKKIAKLGRSSAHRKMLLRNLALNLIKRERIRTTREKAKALRPFIEKLVTRSKDESVHNKRQVARFVTDRRAVIKLFENLGPRFKERAGGYTRIMHLGIRPGDAADMVLIEFVDFSFSKRVAKKKTEKAEKPKEEKPKSEKPKVGKAKEKKVEAETETDAAQ
jgi:large subunit ribosomal protein L17